MTLVENSLLTAAGEDALEEFQTLSTTEQAVHSGNTALGWHALKALTGLIGTFAPTSATAIGSSVINLTGVESKAGPVWEGGTSNTPIIVFRKLTAGVTGLSTGVAYYVVKGTANSFECATTRGGAGIKVAGHTLETGSTEIALLASAEDNTAIGMQAGHYLTTGGGNTLIGENAGLGLTTGEENVAIGCEALSSQSTATGAIAIGFRALGKNTVGSPNLAIGYGALAGNIEGDYNFAIGTEALQANTASHNMAVGHEALQANTTGESNTAIGQGALKEGTTGNENAAVGNGAGVSTTTGSENLFVGALAGYGNTTGGQNTYIGRGAGIYATGAGNVFVGANAGAGVTAESNRLYIANSGTSEPLILGTFPNESLQFNASKMGFFKHATVSQPAKPAETTKAIIEVLEKLGLVA